MMDAMVESVERKPLMREMESSIPGGVKPIDITKFIPVVP